MIKKDTVKPLAQTIPRMLFQYYLELNITPTD